MLMAYIRTIQADQVAADDVWQETMLVAWRRIDDYDASRPFGPWLRGIAHKIVLANYSKAKGKVTITDSESLEYLSQRFESVQSLKGDTLDEKLEALRDCIALLSGNERQCVELRYSQSLMPAELSDRLGVALETIKKRLLRAKQRLVQCITSKIEAARSQEATS